MQTNNSLLSATHIAIIILQKLILLHIKKDSSLLLVFNKSQIVHA